MNNLPRELIGEISNSLQYIDAIALGKTNKQFLTNLSKTDFGYKIYHAVDGGHIFNSKSEYTRRQYIIGSFKHIVAKSLDDIYIYQLDKLWSSLTHLTFESYFNQPVDNLQLPTSLTHLTFGRYFNQSLTISSYLHH